MSDKNQESSKPVKPKKPDNTIERAGNPTPKPRSSKK
tara:strand:+ start:470 stop:580 length:111 start_codon:yes stop_codon:yes gene_type:complete